MTNDSRIETQIGHQDVKGNLNVTYHVHTKAGETNIGSESTDESVAIQAQRKKWSDSLGFTEADARQDAIRTPHRKTCGWIFDRPEFHQWRSPEGLMNHRGLLWIKGKPGVGKTTLMKHVSNVASEDASYGTVLVFFFDARGAELGKSIVGLYRSLLSQLLEHVPDMQDVFDKVKGFGGFLEPRWTIERLQNLLERCVSRLQQRPTTCFIDALDECIDEQIRGMIRFFEDLGDVALQHSVAFRTCISSRHFPYYTTRHGLTIVLEHEIGHRDDIERYIDGELYIGQGTIAQRIHEKMLEKACGIFLWVALVIPMLNKNWDRGRIQELESLLDRVPTELEQLLSDTLEHPWSMENPEQHFIEMNLCFQWVLHSQRPLTTEELYFAIQSGLDKDLDPIWYADEFTQDDMARFILDCSRGLVYITKGQSDRSTVHFIHETVRMYFLNGPGFQKIGSVSGQIQWSNGHNLLRDCCKAYWDRSCQRVAISPPLFGIHNASSDTDLDDIMGWELFYPNFKTYRLTQKLPFLNYAVRWILHHSDAAGSAGQSQNTFMQDFPRSRWIRCGGRFIANDPKCVDLNFVSVLVGDNLSHLLRQELRSAQKIEFEGYKNCFPLLAARDKGHVRCMRELLFCGFPSMSLDQNLGQATISERMLEDALSCLGKDIIWQSRKVYESPLLVAAKHGLEALVHCLVNRGNVSIDRLCGPHQLAALNVAIEHSQVEIVRILLCAGADLSPVNDEEHSALVQASIKGDTSIMKVLLESAQNDHRQSRWRGLALIHASRYGYFNMIKLLLQHGARADAIHHSYGSALIAAASRCDTDATQILLDALSSSVIARPLYNVALMASLGHDFRKMLDISVVYPGEDGRRYQWLREVCDYRRSGQPKSSVDYEDILDLFDWQPKVVIRKEPIQQSQESTNSARTRQRASDCYEVIRLLLEAGADPNTRTKIAAETGYEVVICSAIQSASLVRDQDPVPLRGAFCSPTGLSKSLVVLLSGYQRMGR